MIGTPDTPLRTGREVVSPYRGLEPYFEDNWDFFFGRERECEIIAANLAASRLTLLYGPSGIGKTSVLRAGVVHRFLHEENFNRQTFGAPEHAVVAFSSWRDEPLRALLNHVADAASAALGRTVAGPPPEMAFADALEYWAGEVAGQILIVLDQFEEFFQYQPELDGTTRFEEEFSRAVNRPSLPVNFLVAIREDALAKLDQFKGALPGLFGNYLRLDFLDREAGLEAIEKPLERFSAYHAANQLTIGIEPDLADAVLDQVQRDADSGGEIGRGGIARLGEGIDASLLQVVMRRLWLEETRLGSDMLRFETFRRLGSARDILARHIDEVMGDLQAADQAVAAAAFHYLVTPSGMKIALAADDLANYTGLDRNCLERVLLELSDSSKRILRPVTAQGRPDIRRYEIFHDRLADAILGWRGRYLAEEAARRARKAARRPALVAIAIAGILVVVIVYLMLRPPDISQFSADTPAVAAGTPVHLRWSITGAARVALQTPDNPRDLQTGIPGNGDIQVMPVKSGEYVLVATNWIGRSTLARTTVNVVNITDFGISPGLLDNPGKEAQLHWATEGATNVQIQPDTGASNLPLSGAVRVHPSEPTTYTLIVTGPTGVTLEKTLALGIAPPSIQAFQPADQQVGATGDLHPGDPLMLVWQASVYTSARITAKDEQVAPGQSFVDAGTQSTAVVRPVHTGPVEYTLTVSNGSDSRQASLLLYVRPLVISQFTAEPSTIEAGQTATLHWRVDGANDLTRASIQGVGPVPANGDVLVTPAQTTAYLLSVTTPDGVTIQQHATVSVGPGAPGIDVFSAPGAVIRSGNPVTLTWSVHNADEVTVRTGEGRLIVHSNQLDGSVRDDPAVPTTYILTATRQGSGQVSKDFSVDVEPPSAP